MLSRQFIETWFQRGDGKPFELWLDWESVRNLSQHRSEYRDGIEFVSYYCINSA